VIGRIVRTLVNLAAGTTLLTAQLSDTSNAANGGALVVHIAPFHGAVATTQNQINSETLSAFRGLTAAQIADVTTRSAAYDLTSAIQNVLNYAATSGNPVYFPPGVYKGNWTVSAEVQIIGAGPYKTTFIPATNAPVFALDTSKSLARIRFKDFRIDGSATKDSYTTQDGIALVPGGACFVDPVDIHNVWIKDCGRYGIHTYGTSPSNFVQNLTMQSVLIQNCVQEGIYVEGDAFEWNWQQVLVLGCGDKTQYANVTIGSKISAGHGPSRLTWVGGGINQATLMASTRYVTDAKIKSGANVLTSAAANFTAQDVGTPVFIVGAGTFGGPGLLTTIRGYTNSTTVTTTANASTTVTNAKAMINFPNTGGININSGKQITLKSIDIEACGIPIIVGGSILWNTVIESCNLASSYPMLAGVWAKTGVDGLSVRDWSLWITSQVFHNVMVCNNAGDAVLNSQNLRFRIEPPVGSPSSYSGSSPFLFPDTQSISSNAVILYHPELHIIRVGGAGTINNIFDDLGGINRFTQGMTCTVFMGASNIIMADSVGNLKLAGHVNSLPSTMYSNISFIWSNTDKKWIETGRMVY
jgi:hypothetical protein